MNTGGHWRTNDGMFETRHLITRTLGAYQIEVNWPTAGKDAK